MISPGKILLRCYHQPVGRVRDSLRNGGPLAEWITRKHQRAMELAAARLPALPEFPGAAAVTLHLMTGRYFWYQTLFCLHSFARAAEVNVRAELYDDGTVDAACADHFRRLGRGVNLHSFAEQSAHLDRHLPVARFPVLRERWLNYPNLRKLIDVHLGGQGWKLVLDSDLLFFRRPDFLLRWLAAPDRPLHAVDSRESYGYSRGLMTRLAGAQIPPLVNVGLGGLRSETIDWPELEAWCAELIARERTSYYLEQALIAMLAARQPCAVALAADYLTQPSKAEAITPRAIMHHYVDTSRRWLFRYGWRNISHAPIAP